jgi:opacity protein-like surface antigen
MVRGADVYHSEQRARPNPAIVNPLPGSRGCSGRNGARCAGWATLWSGCGTRVGVLRNVATPCHVEDDIMTSTFRTIGDAIGATVFAVVLAVAPAAAQQTTFEPLPPEPDGLTLTPFVGAGFSGNLESAPAALGIALGYGWSERVAFEGELSIAPNASMGTPIEFDTSFWTLSANILYHFTQQSVTPYITAGLGVLGSSPDLPTELFPGVDDRSTTFAWNIGAGVKTAISDRFGLRADLRHFNGSDLAPDHWRVYGGMVIRRLGR